MDIQRGNLSDERILRLLRHHFDRCHAVTPPGSAHVFEPARLAAPEIDFWAAWEGHTLLGVGAMKPLDATHGEVKSMHTAETARRRGVGSAMLKHIISTSREGASLASAWRPAPSAISNPPSRSTSHTASRNARPSGITGRIQTACS